MTGGAGFIGSHLVTRLVAAGETVRVLERPEARADHLPESAVVIRGDVRDLASVRSAVKGCDYVFHLAANPNLWARDRNDFDTVNHHGTYHVLTAAIEAGAKRVVHVSTESILSRPEGNDDTWSIRTRPLSEDDMIGAYCLSKCRAEMAAWSMAKRGWPILIANPTLPVGPGDRGMSPPTRMTLAFCKGKLPAYVDCHFNLIDVRDVAEGLIRIMERGQPDRRYVLGHVNLSLGDWLALVGEIVGRRVPRWKVPYSVALGIAYLSEFWADRVSRSIPNATVTGVKLTQRSMTFDASSSLAELGLQPRPLSDSIADAVSFFRDMGWVQLPGRKTLTPC